MLIRCAIIDDEPLARKVISQYLEQVSWLELVFEESNPLEAIHQIQKSPADLLFLDVKMPGINGFELLNSLREKPRVILTTAYREYAVEGFEFEVLDYLLKPISFDRFLRAVGKIPLLQEKSQPIDQSALPVVPNSIIIKQDKKYFKVLLEDITHLEALKDYVKVHTINETLITHSTMINMLKKLPAASFVRVQKSFIVNMEHFKSLDGNMIQLSKGQVQLGRTFREAFVQRLMKPM